MIHWFRRRPVAEIRVCLQALGAFTLTTLALHRMSLPTLRRRLWRAFSAAVELPENQRVPMSRVLRCAAVASKLTPLPATCLARALVMEALLRRHGYDVRMRIGVRRPEARVFAAHAWLEYQGRIVVGGPESVVAQYRVLPDLEHLIA
ncbi:MAG TPA: lasso peptide biosynthesis B2 protein [Bryobacteraceae bacterium]|nr:lasso peptide biosynthesis B2 protein [Bryobacteraceae bacterium]